MQLDSNQPQEAPVAAPIPVFVPPQKNQRNYLWVAITLGVLMVLFCVAAAGLGYWANTLKTNLTATQTQLTDLQAQYESSQMDNEALRDEIEALNEDLTGLQAELETTKQELAATQTDLESARKYSETLQAKIDAALVRMDVVLGIFVDFKNVKGIERDIRATEDTKLLDLFQASVDDEDNLEKWFDFLGYLFESIVGELK